MLYNRFDRYIGGSLKKYGEFSSGETEAFRQIVPRGGVVVEIGANIGAHTVPLSRMVGEGGAVLAFEPQRIVFQTLCANLALNQCANVHARMAAVGDKAGQIRVPALPPSVANNFGGLSLRQEFANGEPVPLLVLDHLGLPACHAMKIDVEGMETEVLRGAAETVRRFRPILYVENDRRERSHELIALIASYDYVMYWHLPPLYSPENFAGDPENVFANVVSVNMLCVPKERGTEVRGLRAVSGPDDRPPVA
jgi:FkbM family methyltransferase